MCLTPISIPNPTRRFKQGLSRPFLTVGCGHCKECLKRKEDDMFVRAFFEYKRCVESGGQVWFPTLTYNDDHLPMWHDEEHDFHCQIVDTRYIKKFRDHFRMNLSRLGYPIDDIRFEFVTEYGGQLGRLHHHCLIFMPYKVSERTMVDCIERAWSYRLEPVKNYRTLTRGKRKGQVVASYARTPDGRVVKQKVPKYGFTMWSDKWPKTLQNESAIQYIQKYIHKPSKWLEEYGIPEYEARLKADVKFWQNARQYLGDFRNDLNSLRQVRGARAYRELDRSIRSHLDLFHCEEMLNRLELCHESMIPKDFDRNIAVLDRDITTRLERAVNLLKEWRGRCRFHLQSTFFGFNGISECFSDMDSVIDGRINLYDHGLSPEIKNGKVFLYNMPTYYFRYIFCNKDEHGLYVKNDLYDEVFAARFAESQKRQVEALRPYFDNPFDLAAHLPHLPSDNVNSIFRTLARLMDGRSVEDLVLYQTVYQGLYKLDGCQWLVDCLEPVPGIPVSDDVVLPILRAHALEYLYQQHHTELYTETAPERFKDRSRLNFDRVDLPQWSDLDCFAGFDEVLDLIADCEYGLGAKVDAAWREEQARQEEVSKYLPPKRIRKTTHKFYNYGN